MPLATRFAAFGLALALPTFALPTLASAEAAALVVANHEYDNLANVPAAEQSIPILEETLGSLFTVIGRTGMAARAWDINFEKFREARGRQDPAIVLLSGRFAQADGQTWFLYRNANEPSIFDLDDDGIPLDRLVEVLSQTGEPNLLLLGVEGLTDDSRDLGFMVKEGWGGLEVPDNVAVIVADPRRLNRFMQDNFARRTSDLSGAVDDASGVSRLGSREVLNGFFDFRPTGPDQTEQRLWTAVSAANSVEGYRRYLSDYPDGAYVRQARAGLEALLSDPNRQARGAEESLGLSIEGRRAIQRHLTMLGYNTRGVDGIFGTGTRRAITNWQQQNGFSQTSYLTADQIAVLGEQASRRAEELNRESERERARQQLADQTYWEETGARGDASGLTAYLERFPDGRYADQASRRLAEIERQRNEERGRSERQAWDQAAEMNTERAYQEYLLIYPDGAYAGPARERLAALQSRNTQQQQARVRGEAAEDNLGLNDVTRRLVEARLSQLGLDPGAVDGRFDDDSRRALRRYQTERGLNATGYLDEGTLIRLLADSFGG